MIEEKSKLYIFTINRMHSDYIFVCTNLGCSNVRSRIQIWDLKEAIDPTTKLPLQPFSSHEVNHSILSISPNICV